MADTKIYYQTRIRKGPWSQTKVSTKVTKHATTKMVVGKNIGIIEIRFID